MLMVHGTRPCAELVPGLYVEALVSELVVMLPYTNTCWPAKAAAFSCGLSARNRWPQKIPLMSTYCAPFSVTALVTSSGVILCDLSRSRLSVTKPNHLPL